MKDYQLAWKNLWRNKRRTIITSASVFFAIFFALVMRSFQLGTYDRLFKNVIESYSGYIQIQNKEYLDDPVLDNCFELDTLFIKRLENDANITSIVPRIESFALAASSSHTQGVLVMGIDPVGENRIMNLTNKMLRYRLTPAIIEALKNEDIPGRTKRLLDVFVNESYSSDSRLMADLGISESDSATVLPILRKHASVKNSFLTSSDTGSVIIGSGLSTYLKAQIGDTIVLLGQGYHGTTAAGKYLIKGIIKLPAPDIDNLIVYLPVETARELYAAPRMATSAVINLKDNTDKEVSETTARLNRKIDDKLAVHPWRELNALMVNQMEADSRSGMIMLGILYLVIAFGVFGTVLMMMAERRREFGMLVSIGMQKRKLAKIVSLEMLLMGFIGIIAGVIASLPLIFFGHYHPLRFTGEFARMYEDYGFEPIMPTLLPDTFYLWQVVIVLIILFIAVSFSIRKIFKINVITGLKA